MNLKASLTRKKKELTSPQGLFRNEEGAIDLPSIMVGIVVIGLIGGVIATTVFSVIPWAQDNAAKQQLDSVVAAQSAYFGLSAATPSTLPLGSRTNSFANSTELKSANLLGTGNTYCTTVPTGGKSYTAYSQSSSGKVWSASSKNSTPVIFTGTLPTDCKFITSSSSSSSASYVDPKPTLTIMTFKCDVATSGVLPIKSNLQGKETWSDGTPASTYAGNTQTNSKSLLAGVTYTMTFDGTYSSMSGMGNPLMLCLRSVDHWGMETKVTDASYGFFNAKNLISVPDRIPSTLTLLESLFQGATAINDPDISKWDTSNVTSMRAMFWEADAFNQPINDWNVSKVATMESMFYSADSFNQSLDRWYVSNVNNMNSMFHSAKNFNQPLNSWDTGNVTRMSSMFAFATVFNQSLNSWDTANVTTMAQMFVNATAFNGDITNWNTAKVTDMNMMLSGTAFNRDLSHWNTTALKAGTSFASAAFPNAYLPPKTSK